MLAQPAPTAPELTLEGVAQRQQTILQQLAFVLQEQEACSQAVEVLKDKMITKPELEDLISKEIMTKRDFDAQRAKDLKDWEPLMKQRLTKRWMGWSLAGLGCFTCIALFLTSIITAGAVILLARAFSL